MFQKVRQKMLKKTGSIQSKDLDAPLVKRIQLINQLRDLVTSLLKDTRDVIKSFDQDEGPLRNSYECFSCSALLVSVSVKPTQPEYATSLDKQSIIYDEIGHLQRRLQYDLKSRVETPLTAWLQGEYNRVNQEINKLYDRKSDTEFANADVAKDPTNTNALIQQDLTQREYNRQLEIAKLELLRLTPMRNEIARILSSFICSMKEYSNAVRKLLEKHEEVYAN